MRSSNSGISKMATEMSKEETPKKQFTKIDCKCRRSVLTLLRTVESHARNAIVFNDHSLMTGTVLAQAYKSALLSNILIEGKTLKGDESDLDTTTECEPYDTCKEHHIEHVLMDRLDRQIVNTTRLRKTASKLVSKKMKSLIRPQLKYLAYVSVKTQSGCKEDTERQSGSEATETQSGSGATETQCEEAMETDTPVSLSTVNLGEVQARLQAAAEKCSYVQQNCEDMLQKSRDLSQSLQILKQSEKNEVVKAIYKTPPSTPTRV